MRVKLTTPNDGANAERTLWLAKLRRTRTGLSPASVLVLDRLIQWGLKRDERNRPGGLGRKITAGK